MIRRRFAVGLAVFLSLSFAANSLVLLALLFVPIGLMASYAAYLDSLEQMEAK